MNNGGLGSAVAEDDSVEDEPFDSAATQIEFVKIKQTESPIRNRRICFNIVIYLYTLLNPFSLSSLFLFSHRPLFDRFSSLLDFPQRCGGVACEQPIFMVE